MRLRIDMEDRGGNIELLLPYATIEPIRDVLLQMFMGEKFGRDPIWEGHLATEIGQAEIAVDAVLYEAQAAAAADDEARGRRHADRSSSSRTRWSRVRCGDVTLTEGRMGRVGDRVAVRVAKPLRKPQTTFAMFEKADETTNRVEAPVSNVFGLMIESLVAVLLLLTILLLRRGSTRSCKRLKADERSLKATIAELITATEIAERAIAGLKATVREAERHARRAAARRRALLRQSPNS